MRKFLIFVVLFALYMAGCAAPHARLKVSQQAALSAYVQIACAGQTICTGFPVAPDLVMTAAHCGCNEGELLAVSFDGYSWYTDTKYFGRHDFDVAVIVVNGAVRKPVIFRDPVLGEFISGFGIPHGGIMSFGIVARIEPEFSFFTSIPIGGMSGSAVFGEDGKVVGMVNVGAPDHRVGGTLSGGHTGGLLKTLLESFLEYRKGV